MFVISLPLVAIVLGVLTFFSRRFDSRGRAGEELSSLQGSIIAGRVLGVAGIVLSFLYYVALSQFSSSSVPAHVDEIRNDMKRIADKAYFFRLSPKSNRGGGGSYTGFVLPNSFKPNENADYSIVRQSADTLIVLAIAFAEEDRVQATINNDGVVVQWTYFGKFAP